MKKSANFLMFWVCLLGTPLFVWAQGPATGSPYDPNEMLIKFVSGAPRSAINKLLADYGAVELAMSPLSEVRLWYIGTFPTPGPTPFSNINEVVGNSNSQPEVSGSGLNYGTNLNPAALAIPAAFWAPTGPCGYTLACQSGGKPLKVVIMDTGINYNCPQLSARFPTDMKGYDFVNNDIVPLDDHGHGTHIAGLIDRVIRLSGDPAIQFRSYKTHDHEGRGELFNIILAVDFAVRERAHIINMSFSYRSSNGGGGVPMGAWSLNSQVTVGGGNPNPINKIAPLEAAILVAEQQGILVLAAAGNYMENNDLSQYPCFPASFSCPNILAVASGNCQKQLSAFSNWGPQKVDIVAPGEALLAVGINCTQEIKSGTSQATAVTSALAAVLGTHFDNLDFDYGRVKCAILLGVEKVPNLTQQVLTGGVVHAPNALAAFEDNGCQDQKQPDSRPGPWTASSTAGGLLLSPNPFAAALRVQFEVEHPELAQVSIWDAQGKQVFARQWAVEQGQQEMLWEPAGASPGLYTIRVHTGGGVYTSKAVLLH